MALCLRQFIANAWIGPGNVPKTLKIHNNAFEVNGNYRLNGDKSS